MLQGQAELDEKIWNEFLGATVHKLDDLHGEVILLLERG